MAGMTFTKISNSLRVNQRWLPLPPEAKALWLSGLMFCVVEETDGVIHRVQLPMVDPYHPTREQAASDLVTAGLWAETEAGWTICQFAEHNLTSDQKRFGKQAAAARQAKSRAARTGNPTPTPEPCHTDVTRDMSVTGGDTTHLSRVTNEMSHVERERERESEREKGVQGEEPTGDTPPKPKPPRRPPDPNIFNSTTLHAWWRATRAELIPTELSPPPRAITRDRQAAQELWDLIARNGDPDTVTEAREVLRWSVTHSYWGDRSTTLKDVLTNWPKMSAQWRKQHTTTTTAPATRVAPAADLAALVAQIGPKP